MVTKVLVPEDAVGSLAGLASFSPRLSHQVDNNIKFTQEGLTDNKLPFLDCLVTVNQDRTLSVSVFRKPTHTDQYLQFSSNHPLVQKLGVVNTLYHRADTIITKDSDKITEHQHLRHALKTCGYKDWAIDKALNRGEKDAKPASEPTASSGTKTFVTIPYHGDVSEELKRIFRDHGITTHFKPTNTLRQSLVHPKDKQPKGRISGVVYGVQDLTESETSILAKGLGYCVVDRKIPIAEYITATESAIKQANLDNSKAEELRHKVNTTIRNSKPPLSNITKEENKALIDLGKDKTITIVPSDKGRCAVVLNTADYDSKCQNLLYDQQTYKRVGYNPTSGYRKKVTDFTNKLWTKGAVTNVEKHSLNPPTEPTVPAFYGLPKIHKPEPIPVRPIVSSIGSVTYNLAKYAAKVLAPLVGKTPHHIKNSQAFVDTVKDIKLEQNEIITSYDVSALFTSIPPDDVLKAVTNSLINDPNLSERTNLNVEQLSELVDICLNTAYFSYKGQYYKQIHGCVMGSPLSPIGIDIRMEEFEQYVLKNFPGKPPRLWLRYVDDTFVVIDQNEQDNFFKYINQVDSNIKFTQESSKDNRLAFLDCLVQVNPDNTLSTTVYRKPTHTDQYLQFGSHHPLVHKLGVIRTLYHRADTIISEESDVQKEKDHVRSALQQCGYPDWAFEKAATTKDTPQQNNTGDVIASKARVTIPYSTGLSERIKTLSRHSALLPPTSPLIIYGANWCT
ncbi:uncharacterized protein [Amphiura filiformis]|uniref:uncharacterized protein n=1 Tax=Amphiura filiformis TaxID=82378 RepID=UPI003B21C4FA